MKANASSNGHYSVLARPIRPFLFIYLLPILFSFAAKAQQGTVYGKIIDSQSGEPLISATVRLDDIGVITDLEGNYSFEIPEGTHTLFANYLGYATVEKTISILAGERKEINFQLGESPTMLQTATVTSGKFEKPLGEVTVSLEVLKPRLIEATNSAAVNEVLEKIPGVSIADGQANIRGGSGWSYGAGSRVLLLIDDMPALQADAGSPNWDDVPIENIEQVEVIKGAASALYGSSAMNGIINIRTAYAKAQPESSISTFYTTYGAPKDAQKKWWSTGETPYQAGLSFSHKRKIDKLDLVLGGYAYNLESFRKDTDNQYARLNLGTRYRLSDRLAIGVNGNFNLGNSNSYFYWQDTECDCGSYVGDSTTLSERSRFRYTIDPFVTYFDEKGNRHKLISRYYSIKNDVDNGQSNTSQLLYGEYQYQKNFTDWGLVATTGLVGSRAFSDSELFGDTTYVISNTAAYLQLDKKFFDKLNISGGVRVERNTINSPDSVQVRNEVFASGKSVETKPVFRIGANYQLAPFTFLRASWGQGYRFPTLAEKFIATQAGSLNILPNPNLTSETGWTVELGIKQGFKVSELNGFLDVSVFQSDYTNMMEFELTGTEIVLLQDGGFDIQALFQSDNVGDTRIRGIDVSIGTQGQLFGLPTNIIAGYTYIDPQFKEFDISGKEIPIPLPDSTTTGQRNAKNSSADFNVLKYRSRHSLKFDIETKIKNFSIAIAGNHSSHIEAVDWAFSLLPIDLEAYREVNNKGFKTFDVRMAYQITDGIKISLLGKNIFNEEYTLRPGLLEAPRNGSVRLDWKF